MSEARLDRAVREARRQPTAEEESPFRKAMREGVGLPPTATGEDIRKSLWLALNAPTSDEDRAEMARIHEKADAERAARPHGNRPTSANPAEPARSPSGAEIGALRRPTRLPMNPAPDPSPAGPGSGATAISNETEPTVPPGPPDSLSTPSAAEEPEPPFPRIHRDSDGGVWDEGEDYVRDPGGLVMSRAECRRRYGSDRPWEPAPPSLASIDLEAAAEAGRDLDLADPAALARLRRLLERGERP